MDKLDDLKYLQTLDANGAGKSMELLPEQCRQAWQETQRLKFPELYFQIENVVISGMGGSTYGARVVSSLFEGSKFLQVPLHLSNDYFLPGFAGLRTLVILSSYSGSTEETLDCGKQAKQRNTLVTAVTSGGSLMEFCQKNNFPGYFFNPIHNPSNQPRIGVGYMIIGLIGILAKLNLLPVGEEEIDRTINFLEEKSPLFLPQNQTSQNPAKKWAQKLENKVPIIITADILNGAAYSVRNPFHETAKQFALNFSIPELNHHLLEGLSFPQNLKKDFFFVFVNSKLYHPRNISRMNLTKDIVAKNGYEYENIDVAGETPLIQTMELIQFGSWISYYLAMLNHVNPSKIPWVDYFKMKLSS